jgi:hypothetical protein
VRRFGAWPGACGGGGQAQARPGAAAQHARGAARRGAGRPHAQMRRVAPPDAGRGAAPGRYAWPEEGEEEKSGWAHGEGGAYDDAPRRGSRRAVQPLSPPYGAAHARESTTDKAVASPDAREWQYNPRVAAAARIARGGATGALRSPSHRWSPQRLRAGRASNPLVRARRSAPCRCRRGARASH